MDSLSIKWVQTTINDVTLNLQHKWVQMGAYDTLKKLQQVDHTSYQNYDVHRIISAVIVLFIIWLSTLAVYRIWFHPLSQFPGPYLCCLTHAQCNYSKYIKGQFPRAVWKYHQKYGPIVRIGPNHLSVDGSIAWSEIFTPKKGKNEYYRKNDDSFEGESQNLLGAGHEDHRRMRRQLSHAFSDSTLKNHENIIMKYIDLLLHRLEQRSDNGNSVNIVPWLNYVAFDIIGDLTFNDSFHGLDNCDYHPWVLSVFNAIEGLAWHRYLRAYPLANAIVKFCKINVTKSFTGIRNTAADLANARLAKGVEPDGFHPDFVYYMKRNNRDGAPGMSDLEIRLACSILITAGSETMATAISGILCFLKQNPSCYDTLMEELNSSFSNETEISIRTASSLDYLRSVIKEDLRLYPPAALVTPRFSPGDFVQGKYLPPGTQISVVLWSTFRNPDHFAEPHSFRPERWLAETHPLYDDKFANDNLDVVKPFSHGTRDCIGKNLAYAEMTVILARLLYRFNYTILPGQENWISKQKVYDFWLKGPLRLRLEKRKLAK